MNEEGFYVLVTTRCPGCKGKWYFRFMLRHVFFMQWWSVPVHTHPPTLLPPRSAQISKSLSATTKPARLPAPVPTYVSTLFVFTLESLIFATSNLNATAGL